MSVVSLLILGLAGGIGTLGHSTPAILAKREIARGIACLLSIYDPYHGNQKAQICPEGEVDLNEYKTGADELLDILSGCGFELLGYNNLPFRRSNFIFEYQHYDDNKLRQLAEIYKLERFFTETDGDFAGLVQLRSWVKSRWEHGYTVKEPVRFHNFDSLKILDLAKKGEQFVCGEYSYTYVQSAAAIGAVARVVLVGDKSRKNLHVVSEVWSNKWGKWIMMDVDQDMHYEKKGLPQSALELHQALVRKEIEDIEIIKGRHYVPFLRTVVSPTKGLELYYNIVLRMRNNFFTQYPRWHKRGNLFIDSLEWIDECTEDRFEVILATDRMDDINWELNKTTIYFKKNQNSKEDLVLDIFLDTATPNFRDYLISINGNVFRQKSPKFQWVIGEGINVFKVRAVNAFGREGLDSKIILSKGPMTMEEDYASTPD